MKKRLLAIFLAMVMCLAMLPTAAVAADNSFVIENGVLTKYNGPGGAVTIPDGVTKIGDAAFRGCTSLSGVTIPESVTEIGMWAFEGCTSLTAVTIPANVTRIEILAFRDCTHLSVIQVDAQNTAYTSLDGVLFIKDGKELVAYPGGRSGAYTVPDGVTSIEARAFQGCKNLTALNIPDSVTCIRECAFLLCEGLTDIYYGGSEAQWTAIESSGGEYSDFRADLTNATIHYNSTMPTQPTTPDQPAADVAHASAQTVTVDGKAVEFQMYALKDANGNDTNYIKLRDMAYVLNGTKAQFSVGYNAQDKTITATTGAAYEEDGTEMKATFGGADKEYVKTTLTIQLDGKPVQLEAITLTDDAGGGYNYCKVRDLGQTFNFNVGWKAGVGIYIESDQPYSG